MDTLTQLFREKAPDLMTKEIGRDTVKLHATVMNAKFLPTYTEPYMVAGRHHYVRKTLDVTNVVKVSIMYLSLNAACTVARL